MPSPVTNWGGNVEFGVDRVLRPTTVAELREDLTAAARVRVLGTGHSFSRIADTDGALVSVAALPRTVEVAADRSSVRVSGGTTFAELAVALDAHGLALGNLGSLPHISVAGACSTGTHGSGDRNPCIASTARRVELLGSTGDLVILERGDEEFPGAVLALGALGVVLTIDLDVEPTYDVRQSVHGGLATAQLVESLDEVMAAGHSVSVFTDWDAAHPARVWVKSRTDAAPGLDLASLGATAFTEQEHPVPGQPGEAATVQGGAPGRWYERLPHFPAHVPPSSSGAEIQSEYYVPRRFGPDAAAAMFSIGERLASVLMIAEIRSVARDDLWLSPSQGEDLLGLHFTWHPDQAAVEAVTEEVEAVLEPFEPRPHWGKVFTTPPDQVAELYPRLDDFRSLAERLDPRRAFVNKFLAPYLGTS